MFATFEETTREIAIVIRSRMTSRQVDQTTQDDPDPGQEPTAPSVETR
jgi:hypothetical protein